MTVQTKAKLYPEPDWSKDDRNKRQRNDPIKNYQNLGMDSGKNSLKGFNSGYNNYIGKSLFNRNGENKP